MIEWKTIKYKHQRMASELLESQDQDEIYKFVLSLVKSWDFIDDETGQGLDIDDENCLDELSLAQAVLLVDEFNTKMESLVVPKTNALPSSSSLKRPKKVARQK